MIYLTCNPPRINRNIIFYFLACLTCGLSRVSVDIGAHHYCGYTKQAASVTLFFSCANWLSWTANLQLRKTINAIWLEPKVRNTPKNEADQLHMHSQITILEKANVGGADQTQHVFAIKNTKQFLKAQRSCHSTMVKDVWWTSPDVRCLFLTAILWRFLSGETSFHMWGHNLSPLAGVVETVGSAPEGDKLVNSDLSTEVIETIKKSRAPSMRKHYTLKWRVFRERRLDPVKCTVGSVPGWFMWQPLQLTTHL